MFGLPRGATAKRERSCEAGEGAVECQHQLPPLVLRTTSPASLLLRGGGKCTNHAASSLRISASESS